MAKKQRTTIIFLLLILICQKALSGAIPTVVTTPQILAQGSLSLASSSCLSWCFTGVCVWLKCALFFCSVDTSPRYKHNNPDLVVTVYDELGFDPWVEMNAIYAPFQLTLANTILSWVTPVPLVGGGHQTEGTPPGGLMEDKSLRFKEASAYGHPMSILSSFSAGLAFCPSEATPLFPYFLSGTDALEWRFGLLEMLQPASLIPGARTVGLGGFFQQWGPVFPRTGFVKQKNDPLASAVVAQRVGNIVTGNSGLHVSGHLKGSGFSWTVLPGELIENVPWTGVWQMIAPIPDPVCYSFGSPLPWELGRSTDDNGYAYALWRRYECCAAKGSLITIVPAMACLP